jgi:hypothetical protein
MADDTWFGIICLLAIAGGAYYLFGDEKTPQEVRKEKTEAVQTYVPKEKSLQEKAKEWFLKNTPKKE